MKKIMIVLLVFMLTLFGVSVYAHFSKNDNKTAVSTPQPSAEIQPTPSASAEPTPTPTAAIDFSDTSSILVCANKKHALPDGYAPSDLRAPAVYTTTTSWTLRDEAATALETMFNAAKEDGIALLLGSAYRSYDYQASLYNGYVANRGKEYADTISSRPGYSDHQTGLAVDISDASQANFLSQSFENTAEGQWLHDNAHLYGWIMRYPKDKQDITGYAYEPWHFRYVRVEYATAIYETDPDETFEEYFGVEGGDYAENG